MNKLHVTKYIEVIIVLVTTVLFTIFNCWHIILYYFNHPKGTIFIGITHYYEDYFYYLSLISQGIRGAWLSSNMYTTEAIPPTVLWFPNLLLGKIALFLRFEPWTMYALTIFVTTIVSIISLYWAASKLYPQDLLKRLSTFTIALSASTFYTWKTLPNGSSVVSPLVYFYNYTSSLNRLGGVFHLMLQNILSLFIVFLGADVVEQIFSSKRNKKVFIIKILLLSIIGLCLMFINPVYVALDAFVITIITLISLIKNHKKPTLGGVLFTGIVIGAPLITASIIMSQAFSHPFYQYFRMWENTVWKTTPEIFFRSMGLVFVLSIIGIIPFILRKGYLRFIGLLWAILPIALYFSKIPGMLSLPYFRLTQPPSYIILAALSTESIALMMIIFSKLHLKLFGQLLFTILVIFFVIFHVPVIQNEIRDRVNNHTLSSWMNYLPVDIYQGLKHLEKLPAGNTLSIGNLELIIPVIANKTVYVGHNSLTLNYESKIASTVQFFTGRMPPNEAQQFLDTNNIKYIVRRLIDDPTHMLKNVYPFLNLVFENSGITIYTIK